ncbi:hypothetical protein BpHYR1_016997 [Brachionus plicatilis]|uniref:Uncharacterized protein n=1 Tax=Brachionus plicatilis TaxID=10195 RepID=A0A3M7T6Y6_BRAPC|nr:hypothetical protein BpHYR1_016997 [Brachionus plicatilis]
MSTKTLQIKKSPYSLMIETSSRVLAVGIVAKFSKELLILQRDLIKYHSKVIKKLLFDLIVLILNFKMPYNLKILGAYYYKQILKRSFCVWLRINH